MDLSLEARTIEKSTLTSRLLSRLSIWTNLTIQFQIQRYVKKNLKKKSVVPSNLNMGNFRKLVCYYIVTGIVKEYEKQKKGG